MTTTNHRQTTLKDSNQDNARDSKECDTLSTLKNSFHPGISDTDLCDDLNADIMNIDNYQVIDSSDYLIEIALKGYVVELD